MLFLLFGYLIFDYVCIKRAGFMHMLSLFFFWCSEAEAAPHIGLQYVLQRFYS